jgi:hypothetical protein
MIDDVPDAKKTERTPYSIAVGRRLALCRAYLRMTQKRFIASDRGGELKWKDVIAGRPPAATPYTMTQNKLSQYETGERLLPPHIAAALCKMHGITTDYLYGGERETLPPLMRAWLADNDQPENG